MFQHSHLLLLSAFVEKWQPDMNSFYVPFGKMTVTLYDINLILGILAYDNSIRMEFSWEEIIQILSRDFGRALGSTCDASRGIPQANISVAGDSSQLKTDIRSAIYVLSIAGNSLFTDKNSLNIVDYRLWPIVKNRHGCCSMGREAATLVWLYKNLGQAS